jgi:citrate lyase beta subunit
LKHFSYLSELQSEGFFFKKPSVLTKFSPRNLLQYGVGAALYIPATRNDTADLVISRKYPELCSMVICLEDSIGDHEVEGAEGTVIKQIHSIYESFIHKQITNNEMPLIFIRVRDPEQMLRMGYGLGKAIDCLTGFVFPKFSVNNSTSYLENLFQLIKDTNNILYGMPILETSEVMSKETRMQNLLKIKDHIEEYKDYILNIRIGATDLCGLYGIRRKTDSTIYDISVLRDFIADILNLFGREYVISGPVWEHFQTDSSIQDASVQGLIRETQMDISNGINGKTVIHPTQIKIIQSLLTVSKEDYLDAVSIIENTHGNIGVIKSEKANKMNEIKPHLKWAQKIVLKSEIYGVYHENYRYKNLLTEQNYASSPT